MKCPSCKKENSAGAKFCKYCGNPINVKYNTCPNGHKFDASLSDCPYCPSTDTMKTVIDGNIGGSPPPDTQKTVLDSHIGGGDKTIIDETPPSISGKPPRPDKTVIMGDNEDSPPVPAPGQGGVRKLVGWLVTFDVNPAGMDYRIYEGRTRIGSKNSNDIVLNQGGVSDEHALLLYRNGKFVLQDQLSTNGTYVNNEMIEDRAILNENDIIKVGKVNLKVKII